MRSVGSIAIVCVMLALATTAKAMDPVFQASLTPEVAVCDRSEMIRGLTLSVWGENPQMGLALGFVNGSIGDSLGASFGLVNYADKYTGAQFGFLNNTNETTGAQVGLINHTKQAHPGVQLGFINIIENNRAWFKNFPKSLAPIMIFVNWRFE